MKRGKGFQVISVALVSLLVVVQYLYGNRGLSNIIQVRQNDGNITTAFVANITLEDSNSPSKVASSDSDLRTIGIDETMSIPSKSVNEAVLQKVLVHDDQRRRFWSTHSSRPPLATFIDTATSTVTENFNCLLDFAIIGFAKSGTTTLGTLLNIPGIIGTSSESVLLHKNIQTVAKALHGRIPKIISQSSRSDIGSINPTTQANHNISASLIESQSTFFKIGNRCPGDIRRSSTISNLKQYFPATKLILSVRSPVWWFQSFYNYRISEGYAYKFKDGPNALIRKIEGTFYDVSTRSGEFHKHMAYLQKTPLKSREELSYILPFLDTRVKRDQRLLEKLSDPTYNPKLNFSNPIFFLEISQLSDKNESRSKIFRQEFANFLGLPRELPPVPKIRPNDRSNSSSGKDLNRKQRMINICDHEYSPVREELMHISRNASLWFRKFFMKSEDVFVSSRQYLESIFANDWMRDPCDDPEPSLR